ncbi:MAG: carboxynorspermidine decarboxylase [bacterium]|nr:carboxynorspermidine decarboxylase [bacterium]
MNWLDTTRALPSPCFVVDENLLRANLELFDRVQQEAGVQVLLALKGFATYHVFPLVGRYLAGITASSLNEARLGAEEMKKEVHLYSPAYRPDEIDTLLKLGSHITFNSLNEWRRYATKAQEAGVSAGLRINPEYSPVKTDLYNPCARGSRLGVRLEDLKQSEVGQTEKLDGLHVHNLCESNHEALATTLEILATKFDRYLKRASWLNLGGGHLMTSDNYDVNTAIASLKEIRGLFPHLKIYLEPGSAIAWRTGALVATVLDVVETSEYPVALLDTSFATHMPDCLEMPYRPAIESELEEKSDGGVTYRLGGASCLAGDQVGLYHFPAPLEPGQRLIFLDMAHYTMVKTNTFNGVGLPAIAIIRESGKVEVVKQFDYDSFKSRL